MKNILATIILFSSSTFVVGMNHQVQKQQEELQEKVFFLKTKTNSLF